jgi:Domain of unknown function (DUF4872)/Butirosin biosynthesis protein H, N-terminal
MPIPQSLYGAGKEYRHRQAAHCESGAVSSLLRHYDFDISEGMVFGVSSALLFAHFPFVKVEGFPLTAYRAIPGAIVKSMGKSLGVSIQRECFRDPRAGMDRLDELLARDQVVGMQASVYWLPYFPPNMRFHFNAHNMVVYGKQGDDYLISDPVAEYPVTCPAADLQKARFVKGLFAPKGLLYYPIAMPVHIDLGRAIARAIKKTAFVMLNTPLPFIGVRGIRYLAGRIRRLHETSGDERYSLMYVGTILRMQEEIGTGGGGFRFIYASFLQEAAQKFNEPRLQEASDLMTLSGDAWREFALLGARFCKKKSDVILGQLADAMLVCADHEYDAFRLLRSIRL